jgi:hypothetical protein
VSEGAHAALHQSEEMRGNAEGGNRLVSLAAATIAVLAALGTLFAHHRSISALNVKNTAILLQARASDEYNHYEAKRVRAAIIDALLEAGVYRTQDARTRLKTFAEGEARESAAAFAKAKGLQADSDAAERRSERILHSYEILEIATTFFEVSIVLVSISALVRTPVFLTSGCALSAIGIVLLVFGGFQGH